MARIKLTGKSKIKTIALKEYLIEEKLAAALKLVVGKRNWKGTQIKIPGSHCRWDMGFRANNKFIVVEFDGDAHYRNSLKIKIDQEKDLYASNNGIKVVRIPYWVQLTNKTLAYYFQLKANILQNYPHGFIDSKIFPASYCSLGVDRFIRELNSLPASVQSAVIKSLKKQAKKYGKQFVVPKKLQYLLK